jgi:hypothetical protein
MYKITQDNNVQRKGNKILSLQQSGQIRISSDPGDIGALEAGSGSAGSVN